jgi:hypothetical protein
MQNEIRRFTVEEMMTLIERWLVSGELNPAIFADNFKFSSPFWKEANKNEFLAQFGDPTSYRETALSKITRFDPLVQLKSADNKHFAIVLQYYTKNLKQVYETVYGTISDGLLIELRSIYDLNETRQALEIE